VGWDDPIGIGLVSHIGSMGFRVGFLRPWGFQLKQLEKERIKTLNNRILN